MSSEPITAEKAKVKLNEVAPDGFTSEPRILSHEIAKMREQVTALCTTVRQLVELQGEANQKLDAALSGHPNQMEDASAAPPLLTVGNTTNS